MRWIWAPIKSLGSYTFTTCLLLYLTGLTFMGTIEQVEHGLHAVRERWFASFLLWVGVLPLPGGALALALLFANLLVGGILRLGRRWDRAGILTVHVGIAVLLLGSLWEALSAEKGEITLYPGQTATEFRSAEAWEIRIAERLETGRERVWVIPHHRISPWAGEAGTRFFALDLPFEVRLSTFLDHCEPRLAEPGEASTDGVVLERLPRPASPERQRAGVSVELGIPGESPLESLLWSAHFAPWVVEVAGRTFEIDLARRSWSLPFSVRLVDFHRELHPGTNIPSRFSSDILKVDGRDRLPVHITMNAPLRHRGYTIYQSGWGPRGVPEGTPLFSVFSVVRNPADRVPLYACIIIAFGLAWHFQGRLWRYVRREAGARP